jgi:hypothetical protein
MKQRILTKFRKELKRLILDPDRLRDDYQVMRPIQSGSLKAYIATAQDFVRFVVNCCTLPWIRDAEGSITWIVPKMSNDTKILVEDIIQFRDKRDIIMLLKSVLCKQLTISDHEVDLAPVRFLTYWSIQKTGFESASYMLLIVVQ